MVEFEGFVNWLWSELEGMEFIVTRYVGDI